MHSVLSSPALLDRIEEFGHEICQHNFLPEPLSVAQPSLVSFHKYMCIYYLVLLVQ